ncbi:hypothetical protein GCWU000324_01931 [Kingella oralis ATCC 51147]|uniref:Uncharacterized protein n=1 Tax=Kingella oralis ATCC 51147 TaxID=629741 RepID=C4GIR0_9NEIS|nr:hypothetical protein GCWU000324_01931 [Kingella oralis ATCC 51147]
MPFSGCLITAQSHPLRLVPAKPLRQPENRYNKLQRSPEPSPNPFPANPSRRPQGSLKPIPCPHTKPHC